MPSMTREIFCDGALAPSPSPARTRGPIPTSIFIRANFCGLGGNQGTNFSGGLRMAVRSCKRLFHSPCARRVAIGLSLAVALTVFAAAQNTNGRVIGIVTDPQGAAVPGAKATVTNVGTNVNWNTMTDDKGNYQVLDVPIGMYTVTIESRGFAKAKTEPQELTINQALRIDIHMKVGGVNEVVDVQSQASQVETVNPTIGGTVTGKPIQDLPLNGRNTLDLALTQPGVIPIADDIGTYGTSNGGSSETGLGGISIAGGRGDAVTYLLDGGMNNRTTSNQVVFNPNPEAVEEFRLLENNYTAEYGRNGGGTISVVLKSGTNALHGSLFEYLRNDAMNANDYIDNEIGQPRQVLKRNQFGGVIGGPITLGNWLNGKDRLFFFFGYQGQRLSQTVNEAAISRAGDGVHARSVERELLRRPFCRVFPDRESRHPASGWTGTLRFQRAHLLSVEPSVSCPRNHRSYEVRSGRAEIYRRRHPSDLAQWARYSRKARGETTQISTWASSTSTRRPMIASRCQSAITRSRSPIRFSAPISRASLLPQQTGTTLPISTTRRRFRFPPSMNCW